MQLAILQNYFISFIRTAVPIIVGAVASWFATKHIILDGNVLDFLTFMFEGLFGMLYYVVVRMLEHLNYRFGWLLGYAKMPTYVITPTDPTAPTPPLE